MRLSEKRRRETLKILDTILKQAEAMAREHGLDLDSDFSMKKPNKEEKNA